MITYTGQSIWPTWTEVEGVPIDGAPSIADIAVGLGRQSRFAGQTRDFYSVLCHSIACAHAASHFYPGNDLLRRHLLTHDGHEAIISDVPTTWKTDATRADEAELDRRIAASLGLAPLNPAELAIMRQIDAAALAAEAHALGHAEAEKWWPKEKWDDLVWYMHEETLRIQRHGYPVSYLSPEVAISAMVRVYG